MEGKEGNITLLFSNRKQTNSCNSHAGSVGPSSPQRVEPMGAPTPSFTLCSSQLKEAPQPLKLELTFSDT